MCWSTLQQRTVVDPNKDTSMHKVPFFDEEYPIKKKEVDQFRAGEVQDVGAGEDVLFQNIGTAIHMFKFGCKLLLLFSSLLYLNTGHILEFICTWFSLFSLGWVGSNGKSLCYFILNTHATRFI